MQQRESAPAVSICIVMLPQKSHPRDPFCFEVVIHDNFLLQMGTLTALPVYKRFAPGLECLMSASVSLQEAGLASHKCCPALSGTQLHSWQLMPKHWSLTALHPFQQRLCTSYPSTPIIQPAHGTSEVRIDAHISDSFYTSMDHVTLGA